MDTSTTTFCKFSPLRTPHIKQNYSKQYHSPRKEVSDTDSIISMVTKDVRKIAKSVSDRLKENSENSVMSSDDEIFISQSKKVMKPTKTKTKRVVSDSDSDLRKLVIDTSDGKESELEDGSTSSKTISPKKRRKLEAEGINQRIKSQVNSPKKSPMKSPGKSRKRMETHISDSHSDIASLPAPDSRKKKRSVSSVSSVSSLLLSSSDSSDGDRETGNKASSPVKRSKRRDSSSPISDINDSERDSGGRSRDKGKQMEHKNLKKVRQENNMSEDSDFDTKQAKKKSKKGKAVVNEDLSASNNRSKLRYKVPDGFEIDTSQEYLSKAELQGKQLWLISTPDDFDISSLHRQKIKMNGSSVVSTEDGEDEKQFEVLARPFTSQMSTYNSVALETSGNEDFAIGSEICGQIQVMDCIPAMPPVEIIRPPPSKHRVPDNLKATFEPFGSESPTRQNDDDCVHVHKTEKHKKKKKKKDKRKE